MRTFPWRSPLLLAALALAACGDDDGAGNQNHGNENTNTNRNGNDAGSEARCGDGVVQAPEACDDASANSATTPDACRPDCTLPRCGDGVVDPGPALDEQCDPPAPGFCDEACRRIGAVPCGTVNAYDAACVGHPGGAWCGDGGTGGDPFCGCDPAFGDVDCRDPAQPRCDPATDQCVAVEPCGLDAGEPNGDEAGATPLAPDEARAGALCVYDRDWYTFTTGPDDSALVVTLDWTGEADLDLWLTDCAGTRWKTAESPDGAQEVLRAWPVPPSRTWCVAVEWFQSTAAEVGYTVTVDPRRHCVIDPACPPGEHCPWFGLDQNICQAQAPAPVGCGDAVPGADDVSSFATPLVPGVGLLGNATCDSTGPIPSDVDFFQLEIGDRDRVVIEVRQRTGLAAGTLKASLLDADGASWAHLYHGAIQGQGFRAGTYYLVVSLIDLDPGAPSGEVTYDATATVTPGPGCAVRNDCGGLVTHGDCADGFCVPFVGNGAQGPLEYCDSASDCDPDTTGSSTGIGPCVYDYDGDVEEHFCITDCHEDADCQVFRPAMHCVIFQGGDPPGVCLNPCVEHEDCHGLRCGVDGRCYY